VIAPMNPPKSSPSRSLIRASSVVLLGLLGACNVVPPAQDDPTRYFVLSDAVSPEAVAAPSAAAEGGLRIGLRTVRIESYLKNRAMVVRTAANEVKFEEYHRWAEPVDAAIGRVLRSRLVASPGVAQVYTEPFPFDQARDFDVSIEVLRFEGAVSVQGGKDVASFKAWIEVSTAGANARVVARKLFVAHEQDWDGKDFDQLAALLTGDVGDLGQDVLGLFPAKQ
jgi:uncharacterized lipoprotein YmbA